MPAPEDLELPLAAVDGPLQISGVLESVVDGILVRGTLRAPLVLTCARCLAEIHQDATAEVAELYSSPERLDPDDELDPGYEIIEERIDLDTLLRDALIPAVPYQPLCRPDCAGLCPTCGIDRNTATCDCADTTIDPRWAALEGLRLPDDGSGRR
ncbi:MAG TPA: DUF177 domain-containing protein [Egibacteraceae bacterium]